MLEPRRALDVPRRAEAWPVALLLALAAAAWVLTGARMGGMAAGPWSDLGDIGAFTVSWPLMMTAMMLPAIAPIVIAYDSRGSAPAGGTGILVAGYLLTWLAAGLVAYAVIEGVRSLDPSFLAWDELGRPLTAAVIAAAALYQLTPAKAVCLRHCRDTRGFLRERWRSGRGGALRMGLAHGAVCVGCSWALMAALFALGAMSLTWMAIIAALVAAERLLPWTRAPHWAVAAALVALAAGVALAPGAVPGLTLPGQAMGM
jgi:predicted metal-binding membrane protein